jgi:hypothetical protein
MNTTTDAAMLHTVTSRGGAPLSSSDHRKPSMMPLSGLSCTAQRALTGTALSE